MLITKLNPYVKYGKEEEIGKNIVCVYLSAWVCICLCVCIHNKQGRNS